MAAIMGPEGRVTVSLRRSIVFIRVLCFIKIYSKEFKCKIKIKKMRRIYAAAFINVFDKQMPVHPG